MRNENNGDNVSASGSADSTRKVVFSFGFLNRASAQAFAVAVEGPDVQVTINEEGDGAAPCNAQVTLVIGTGPDAINDAKNRLLQIAAGQEGHLNEWAVQDQGM